LVRGKKQIILSGIFDDLLEWEQYQSKEVVHTASGNPNIKKDTGAVIGIRFKCIIEIITSSGNMHVDDKKIEASGK
jgi:hypothetical protein